MLTELGGRGFGDFKKALAEVAVSVMGPIGSEMQRLSNDPATIDAILRRGGERARDIARPIVEEVYDIVGFLRP